MSGLSGHLLRCEIRFTVDRMDMGAMGRGVVHGEEFVWFTAAAKSHLCLSNFFLRIKNVCKYSISKQEAKKNAVRALPTK